MPFLIVFGVLGLFLSVLIIAIVVSGAVVSAIRRIGILKSLGFTPGQVARAYAAQALIPAAFGVVAGTLFGNLLAVPVLNGTSHELGAARPACRCGSASGPDRDAGDRRRHRADPGAAGRPAAGRADPGRGPGPESRARPRGPAPGLPPPAAPVDVAGLAQPFARPARAALVGAAVLFGAVSVTFAFGLEAGFSNFQDQRSAGLAAASVIVVPGVSDADQLDHPQRPGGDYGPNDPRTPHLDVTKVSAALADVPGTKAAFGWGDSGATVIGAPTDDQSQVDTISGDLSWTGMELIDGRWYSGHDEAVMSDRLASAMGTHVGDTVTVVQQGKPLALKVVGIAFDAYQGGRAVLVDSATFTAAGLTPHIDQFNVELGPNVDGPGWTASATAALTPLNASVDHQPSGGKSDVVVTMSALVATLSLMLLVVAALGVLNTVVQDTRERIHDLGVFKALGMTPRQTVTMVLTSVALTGLIAGLIGVPIGAAVERATITPMGNAVGMHLPPSVTHTYSPGLVLPLLAGGIIIALLGALLPAGWAAQSRTATALRTE